MFLRDRRRARFVSDYADSLLSRRRGPEEEASAGDLTSRPEDFVALLDVVRQLDALEIVAPAPPVRPWRRDPEPVGASQEASAHTGLRPVLRNRRLTLGWHHAVTVAAFVLAVAVAFLARGGGPMLSAADVLRESDAALEELLGSGEGLHRLWDASYRIEEPDGTVNAWNATVHEWIQGTGQTRVARRAFDDRGRLLWVHVTEREPDDQVRARQYYTLDQPTEPRGLVTVDATANEYREAAASFPRDDRSALELFFQRSYGPGLGGERAYNRATLGTPGAAPAEPLLSLTDEWIDGERLHRVQIFESHRLWFTRSSDGALAAALVRFEQTRFISPRTGLTVKFITRVRYDTGRETTTTWAARSKDLRRLGEGDQRAFVFDPPAGLPVRPASARDDLTRMLPALRVLRAERAGHVESVPTSAAGVERR
jgi:hypothetical protein